MKWCLDNSISSQVTTPATAQDLSTALISALESNTVSPVSAPNDITFDILLAEDNLVNQKLAVKILEKYGHSVEIAENGSLAVDAFKARVAQGRPFDIVLVRATCQKTEFSLGGTYSHRSSSFLFPARPYHFFMCRWTFRCRSWVEWRQRSLSVHLSRTIVLNARRLSR